MGPDASIARRWRSREEVFEQVAGVTRKVAELDGESTWRLHMYDASGERKFDASELRMDRDLFTGGRYTDYGLAVQTTDTAGATAIVSPLSGDLADIITLNVPLDSPADGHYPASHVALPSNIDELGVRDLLG